MNQQIEPTDEGKRRYPEADGYLTVFVDPIACTCQLTCQPLCTGECGCEACGVLFAEFCDEAGCAADTEAELERARWRYRGEPVQPS